MADEKRKVENSFQKQTMKTNFLVKLIVSLAMDSLKSHENENGKIFLFIDIARIISETGGISIRQIFNIKKSSLQLSEIYLYSQI